MAKRPPRGQFHQLAMGGAEQRRGRGLRTSGKTVMSLILNHSVDKKYLYLSCQWRSIKWNDLGCGNNYQVHALCEMRDA